MKHIGLFEGIGGFGLAASWAGWETIAWCEINDFGKKVLKHQFPNAKQHGDIKTTDFTIYRGKCDIVTGGFPCQPFSLAGKRLGKEDDRAIWPQMLRAIREIKPAWVVGENVPGIISWDGGLVFEEVQVDLENEGYEVQPVILPACAVNAPHRRDRVWFIAYRANAGIEGLQSGGKNGVYEFEITSDPESQQSKRMQSEQREFSEQKQREFRRNGSEMGNGITPDPDGLKRSERGMYQDRSETSERYFSSCHSWNAGSAWDNFPTQSPICSGNDGLPGSLVRQRIRDDSMGYLSEKEIDKIISKAYGIWRNEAIKAYGNAIVPQVAFKIFKAINMYVK